MSIAVVAASCAGAKIPFPFMTIDVVSDPQTTMIDELPAASVGSAPARGAQTAAIEAMASAVASSNFTGPRRLSSDRIKTRARDRAS